MHILVLNPGSATLKATVIGPPDRRPRFDRSETWRPDHETDAAAATRAVIAAAHDVLPPGTTLDAVGYRVVHGGERFTAPTLIDDATVDAIEDLGDLAPVHNPVAAQTIRAGRATLPGIPHAAVFDTAFHATLPESAIRYPVPDAWRATAGIRRYGFHGLSVAWSLRRAAELLDRPTAALRLVIAHLGGGCSVTAVEGGRSVDTSMGMTPLEGLMMGTRAGSIDPGIIFRLLRMGVPIATLETDLDRRSGLLAVGGTSDMRRLQELEAAGDGPATLAIAMFVERTAAAIAAATTHLTAVDGIVFTGGIGEHATDVTQRIADRLHLPAEPSAGPAILRIPAREDLVVADAVVDILGAG